MLGPKQEAQAALFYEFSLKYHVPEDHLLCSIDRFVDLSDIRQYLADFYSHTGRLTATAQKPPQVGQSLSCTAANARSLIRRARAFSSDHHFLRSQHVVFPQNGRKPDLRCNMHQGLPSGQTRLSLVHSVLTQHLFADTADKLRLGAIFTKPANRSGNVIGVPKQSGDWTKWISAGAATIDAENTCCAAFWVVQHISRNPSSNPVQTVKSDPPVR